VARLETEIPASRGHCHCNMWSNFITRPSHARNLAEGSLQPCTKSCLAQYNAPHISADSLIPAQNIIFDLPRPYYYLDVLSIFVRQEAACRLSLLQMSGHEQRYGPRLQRLEGSNLPVLWYVFLLLQLLVWLVSPDLNVQSASVQGAKLVALATVNVIVQNTEYNTKKQVFPCINRCELMLRVFVSVSLSRGPVRTDVSCGSTLATRPHGPCSSPARDFACTYQLTWYIECVCEDGGVNDASWLQTASRARPDERSSR
jgi:hypothetical protein